MSKFSDINLKLCHYCGTCVSVCPQRAISIEDGLPYLSGKCSECGLCYGACPGIEYSYPEFTRYLFNGSAGDEIIGNYRSAYFGYSCDAPLRNKASAGGVITAILSGLLERGKISAAIVVGMRRERPWDCEVKLARTKDEIYQAAQSKYSMVPLNAILAKINAANVDSVALVGLPCHIHGIRKLQKLNSESVKKVKYCIGLFCGMNLSKGATDYLISRLKINKNEISSLEYRGGDWPGGFTVKTNKQDRKFFIKKDIYNFLQPMFAPGRCLLCPDLMNEFADIAVGDAWDNSLDKQGWSIIIARTSIGDELVNKAVEYNYIKIKPAHISQIYKGHAHLIAHKKNGFNLRKRYFSEIPKFDLPFKLTLCGKELILNYLSIFLFRFMKNKIIFNCVKYIPLGLFVFLSRGLRLISIRVFKPIKEG